MPLKFEDGYAAAICDDPHQRGCTNWRGAIAAGEQEISDLERCGWSVDGHTGVSVCPMCRAIPFGGDDVAGKMAVEELFGNYERLCGRAAVEINRQADDPMAERTLKHMLRYKNEILRRLRLVPKIVATDLQPK